MKKMYQRPKGTQDLLPSESYKNHELENIFKSICYFYNYHEMRTPIFERSEVFHRTSGEESDIVRKETYDFKDRGNRDMTLRPEGTAGICRAFIENKLYANNLQYNKIYYINAPMFRYERPQSGRLRQHTQFGIECFGEENPLIDAEVIAIGYNFLKYSGIKNMVVKINSLGDDISRSSYRKALVDYLIPKRDTLCEDCQRRIDTNPLRVLDCKIDSFPDAPDMSDYRTEEAKDYFEKLKQALTVLDIPFEVDNTLVRGLDYYTNTVFEIQATIPGFGAKATLCAGGRYNKLVKKLAGPDTSSCGFGLGIERLLLALEAEGKEFDKKPIEVFVCHQKMPLEALEITSFIRDNGFVCEMDYSNRKLSKQLSYANKQGAKTMVIVAPDEYKNNQVIVKQAGKQENVAFSGLSEYLEKLIYDEDNCNGECEI